MNGEIKFRIWDKSIKSYLNSYEDENPYLFFNLGVPYNLTEILSYHLRSEENGGWDRFVIEQFTGSKDKYGKEIYEGDILKCQAVDGYYHEYELIGNVEFQEFEYVIFTNDPKWPCASFKVLRAKEVIGNILENPELLC